MNHDSPSPARPESGEPRPAGRRYRIDREDGIEVESVVNSVVMIGLMCFTGLLFSACFDLVTIA